MIDVRFEYGLRTVLTIEGHADEKVCAPVSWGLQTLILGLKALAEEHPEEIRVKQEYGALTA